MTIQPSNLCEHEPPAPVGQRSQEWCTWFPIKHARNGMVRCFGAALKLLGRPWIQAIEAGYEKAGITVRNEPVPWNADAVVIDAVVRIPLKGHWTEQDFWLRLDNDRLVPAVRLQPEKRDTLRITFRLLPLQRPADAYVYGRGYNLGKVRVSFLSAEQFFSRLRLECGSVFAKLGEHHVACEAVVASQCRGLVGSGLLTSPTSLVPLIDLGLRVDITDREAGSSKALPITLTSAQLACRQAILNAPLPDSPTQDSRWSLRWLAGDRTLGTATVKGIAQQAFEESLYLIDGLYAYEAIDGATGFTPYLPAPAYLRQWGPCFRLASRERGVAGLSSLQIRAAFRGDTRAPILVEQEALVTEGPTLITPLWLPVNDLKEVSGFELFHCGAPLGVLASHERPTPTFTSEGGFKDTDEFAWTPLAEQELADRLGRLFEIAQDAPAQSIHAAAASLPKRLDTCFFV